MTSNSYHVKMDIKNEESERAYLLLGISDRSEGIAVAYPYPLSLEVD
jgi:hypothetical protein